MGTSVATTPYTFRIIVLQYVSSSSYFSDYGNPTISMTQMSKTFTLLGFNWHQRLTAAKI